MSGWGDVWLDAIFRLYPGAKGKLAMRGRTYLNAKRVVDVHLDGATVRARVIGYHRVPYHVTINLRPLAEDVWRAAIDLIARDHRCAASIRQGVLPLPIVSIFDAAGDALIPQDDYAVSMKCGCPARGETCDHIMGVHMWIAAAVDRDPFLLFTLRGGSKDAVLGVATDVLSNGPDGSDSPTNPLHQLLGPEAAGTAFDSWRAPVAVLQFNHDTNSLPDQLLAQLGDPPAWDGKVSLHETLAPVYRGAARRARTILSAVQGNHSGGLVV